MKRAFWIPVCGLFLVPLSGCMFGSGPKEEQAVTASLPEPKPTLIRLFFATSRQAAGPELSRPGKHPRYFSEAWNEGDLTYGQCWVTMPTNRELPPGEIEGSTWFMIDLNDNPGDDVWMHSPRIYTNANEFVARLKEDIPKRRDRNVLIGVHGFNNTFEFAGRRMGKMVHDMNYHGTPVLYSWAAGETVAGYERDEERVEHPQEIDHFIDFLKTVVQAGREGGASQIHLVAHSMGNRLVQHAARRLAREYPDEKLFDAVVLAAPDVPRTGFANTIWPSLQAVTDRCSLYVSAYDRALFGSQMVHRTGARLGQAGETPLVLPGMETIDASGVRESFLNHDSHLRLAGICDLNALLIHGWAPERRVSIGSLLQPGQPAAAAWFLLAPREGNDCDWR